MWGCHRNRFQIKEIPVWQPSDDSSLESKGGVGQAPTNAPDLGDLDFGLLLSHPPVASWAVFPEVHQQESTQQLSPLARTLPTDALPKKGTNWVFYYTLGNVSKAFVFFPHSFLQDPSDLPT